MPVSIGHSAIPEHGYPFAALTPPDASALSSSTQTPGPARNDSPETPTAPGARAPSTTEKPSSLRASARAWETQHPGATPKKDTGARKKRELAIAADLPRRTLGHLGSPSSHSSAADQTLLTQLIQKMGSVADVGVTVPPLSLIERPFAIYKQVVNQPEVLGWLRGMGFALDSVTIGPEGVSGLVTRNGVVSRQAYTLQDTSGWWQVSGRVMRALEALDPGHHGVPYVALNSLQVSRNVASHFYGVRPPFTDREASALVANLRAGWPSLSPQQLRERALRLEWSKRGIDELDDRENLAKALQRSAQGTAGNLSLSDTEFEVSASNPLKNDDEARRHLNRLVARIEMRWVLEDLGHTLPDQPVRISEGQLQVLQPVSNQWLDVPVSDSWSQALRDKLAELVVLSAGFGDALYSDERRDLRQVAQSMNLGPVDTPARARAAADWLRTDFAPPASGGNYAALLPQEWAPGTLSTRDKHTLAGLATDQKYGANTIGYALANQIVTQVDPQETAAKAEQLWHQILNTPQVLDWGRELARALNWSEGGSSEGIDSATLRNLVTSTLMLSVDPAVPATAGTAAGYQFYAPANMGREMGAVRKDFEQHLVQKKGVSLRAAPLIAHLFLAHAAPEFLVRPDQQPSSMPEQLRQSLDKIRIASPAWMTLSLGTALAEVWGGAGASRGMNLKELGALTSLEGVQPQQQVLAMALGAKVLLQVGVMTGVVPSREDGRYTENDYQAASGAIAQRSAQIEKTLETLGTAPPTRSSLATRALREKFPELTESELTSLTLKKPATKLSRLGPGINPAKPTLVEAYATGDLHVSTFGFSHPLITQTEFNRRIQSLPKIADQVTGAVDQYLADIKAQMPGLMKMSLANLPLEDRQAFEWGKVDIFRLRQETGETQPQDAAKGNKVAKNRGWHGVLLRSEYQGKTRYYEFFPTSGTIINRTADLARQKLKLDGGVIEEEREYFPRKPSQLHRFLRGTVQPFDFDAYLTGDTPRPGASSKVIISKVGNSLAGASTKGQGDDVRAWVPDTFRSVKSQSIIDAILQGNYIGNYSGHRQELIDHASAVLPSEDTISGYVDRLMTKENARAMFSMISFVGPLIDIAEGNVRQGLTGLAIDMASFIGTGGVQATYKAWKAVKFASRLNRQAFCTAFFKEGTALLRGVLNPAEGFVDLVHQPGKFANFLQRKRKGLPTKIGMGLFVPADVYEKLRFSRAAYPTVFEMLKNASATATPSVKGTVNQVQIEAVTREGHWYAVDPRTGTPFGPPLQGFVPAPA
ncbi:hypothetical protein [Pseudomonas graminis]